MQKLTYFQQEVLACVAVHSGQFTRSGLAKLLAGSGSMRLEVDREDEWYGRFDNQTRKSITYVVDTLLQQGFLTETWDGKLDVSR